MKLLERPGYEVLSPCCSDALHHFYLLLTLSVASYFHFDGQVATAPDCMDVSRACFGLCGDALRLLSVNRPKDATMCNALGCDDAALGRYAGGPSAA
jgi:hypothetical protein